MWMIIAALAGISLATAPSFAAEPLATTEGEAPGIALQIQELKVSNGTAMLKLTVVNNGSSAFNPDTLADKDTPKPDYHSISGIYLIDAANKKKYLVVYDTNNECICSRRAPEIDAKSSVNLWAKFPAPPEGVTKIGVVVPHFAPIDDVPLSR